MAPTMSHEERARLRTIIDYWVEHNKEHCQEFKEWAEKAKGMGEADVGNEILFAAQELDKTNEFLSRALHRLRK